MNRALSSKRRDKDIMKLMAANYKVESSGTEASTYSVQFAGPKETPYERGSWTISLFLPEEYPYKSPSVGFSNRIYHPNIDFCSGSVCLDVINQTWTPMYELVNIFEIFLPQLLTYPNPSSPLNHEAAELYERDRLLYQKKVTECVEKHALKPAQEPLVQADPPQSSCSECSLSDSQQDEEDLNLY